MSSDLAQAGARQRLASDGIVGEAPVRWQLARYLADRIPHRLVEIDVSTPPNFVHIGHDHGDEPPLDADHADLLDERMLEIDILDVLGLDLFAALRHYQRGDASGDVQVPLIVQMAEIPGAKPSVGEHFRGLVRQVEIARENVRAAREDLARCLQLVITSISLRLSVLRRIAPVVGVDANLNAGDGLPGACEFGRARRVNR